MTSLPPFSLPGLKAQAKRLRAGLQAAGTPVSHAQALELLAHQHGARDWNTLQARAAGTTPAIPDPAPATRPDAPPFTLGDAVSGTYLGQQFTGQVRALSPLGAGHYRITLHFDAPVDVVASESFSSFRQRIHATIDATGTSPQKTSNGLPQLTLTR